MANTYTLISSVTVGAGGASSIDFISIPNTYTDLCLVTSLRSNRSAQVQDQVLMTLNSTTSGFTWKWLYASNNGTASGSSATRYAGQATAAGATSSTFSSNSIYIPNYAGSNYKSYSIDSVIESNAASIAYNQSLETGLWSNTAAITSISLTPEAGSSFNQYSIACLYGIKNS